MKTDPANPTVDAVTDPNRLAALEATGLLDSPPEEVFDRFTRLASRILGCPVSLVSLVTANRQFFKSQTGLPAPWSERRETPLSHSFCQHVVRDGALLRIEDARQDERVRGNAAVTDLGVIAYLGVPIHSEDGMVLGSFCVIEPRPRAWTNEEVALVQELARALASEIRLRERTKVLLNVLSEKEEAEVLREQMLHMLVHDLRSPAAMAQNALDLLDPESATPADVEELLGIAKTGIGDLLALVNQILDTHRIRSGKYEPDLSEVNISHLLREVFQRTLPLAESSGQTLFVHYPDGGATVLADEGLLRRVLLNLATNAVKYAGAGASIRLGVRFPKSGAIFEVSDNGPGIPDDQKESIFEPFVTEGAGRMESLRSHGIGLAFCRLAVGAMNGTIRVVDAPGGGSSFLVSIPRKEVMPA